LLIDSTVAVTCSLVIFLNPEGSVSSNSEAATDWAYFHNSFNCSLIFPLLVWMLLAHTNVYRLALASILVPSVYRSFRLNSPSSHRSRTTWVKIGCKVFCSR